MTTKVYPRITKLTLLWLLASCPFMWSQNSKVKRESRDKGRLVFKLPVDVIAIRTKVRDRDGNSVTDLKQSDFKIYEDGKPQTIQTFAIESYKPLPSGKPQLPDAAANEPAMVEPNATRPRMISFVIEDVLSAPDDRFVSVVKAVTKFVETDMQPGDQVAIRSSSGRVQFIFSQDKPVLLAETATLLAKLNQFGTSRSSQLTDLQAQSAAGGHPDDTSLQKTLSAYSIDPNASYRPGVPATESERRTLGTIISSATTGEARIQDESNRIVAMKVLDDLDRQIRSLRHFEASKSVIFFPTDFYAATRCAKSFRISATEPCDRELCCTP
jgi:VWFA-related protein